MDLEILDRVLNPNGNNTPSENGLDNGIYTNNDNDNNIEDNSITDNQIDSSNIEEQTTTTDKPKRGRPPKNNNNNQEVINNEPVQQTQYVENDESEIANNFANYFFERAGWEKPDTQFNNVDEFVDFIYKVIEVNSKPKYSNPIVQDFDEFLNNGGNILDYLNLFQNNLVDIANINLSTPQSQQYVITKFLKETTNWDDDKIGKYITKLENANMLEDEARDAYDKLRMMRVQNYQNEIENQKKLKEQQEQLALQKLQEYNDILENKYNTVLGMNKREVEVFKRFVFEQDENGLTPYQRLIYNDGTLELKIAALIFKSLLNQEEKPNSKQAFLNAYSNKTNNKSNKKSNNDVFDSLDKIFKR